MARVLDALVFSSLWLAAAAGMLVAAATRAMETPLDPRIEGRAQSRSA